MTTRQKPGARPEKLADFFEAAYDVAADDRAWMRAVMEGAIAVFGRGTTAHGAIYDASDVASFRVMNAEFIGLPPEAVDCIMRGLNLFTPSFVARTFRSLVANGLRAEGF